MGMRLDPDVRGDPEHQRIEPGFRRITFQYYRLNAGDSGRARPACGRGRPPEVARPDHGTSILRDDETVCRGGRQRECYEHVSSDVRGASHELHYSVSRTPEPAEDTKKRDHGRCGATEDEPDNDCIQMLIGTVIAPVTPAAAGMPRVARSPALRSPWLRASCKIRGLRCLRLFRNYGVSN